MRGAPVVDASRSASRGVMIADSFEKSAQANAVAERVLSRIFIRAFLRAVMQSRTESSIKVVAIRSVLPEIHATDSAKAG